MRSDSNSRDFYLNNELFIAIDRAFSLSSVIALIGKGANSDALSLKFYLDIFFINVTIHHYKTMN